MNIYCNFVHVRVVIVVCFTFMLIACGNSQQTQRQDPPLLPTPPSLPNLPSTELPLAPDNPEPPIPEKPEEPELLKVITVPYDSGRSGQIDDINVAGVSVWQLPDAPSGSQPDQSWLAVGSDAQGEIYISGHDHHSNSMLYRLFQRDQTLRWVGDARTASQDADNWLPGETAEKFHTRPIAHDGRVYVATLDKSGMDSGFLQTRGFHWYGYDKQDNQLLDLSAAETAGVGAEHLQIVSIQKDPLNNLLYGMSIPENKLVVYDIEKGQTTVLGNPEQWNGYFYSNRFMWVDSGGRVYISGGSERQQWHQGEAQQVFNHVWYYDPKTGFGELTDFTFQGANALEVGQWDRKHENLYVSDDQGNIYRFSDATASWRFLGRPNFSKAAKTWVFQLSADDKKIYIGLSDMGASQNAIYEFDIATGASFELVNMDELDSQVSAENFIAGYDSWDRSGNFHIAAFSMYDGENVLMLAINPVKIKAAKGLLPELVEVAGQQVGDSLVVRRSGASKQPITLLYELKSYDVNNQVMVSEHGELSLVAGQTQLSIKLASITLPSAEGVVKTTFEVIADANNYILRDNKTITLNHL